MCFTGNATVGVEQWLQFLPPVALSSVNSLRSHTLHEPHQNGLIINGLHRLLDPDDISWLRRVPETLKRALLSNLNLPLHDQVPSARLAICKDSFSPVRV